MSEQAQDRIVVTGAGLTSSGGHGIDASWKTVRAGTPTAAPDPVLEDAGLDVTISCRVPEFDPEEAVGRKASRRLDRYTQLALLASRDAVRDADLPLMDDDDHADRVGVVFGCGIGGMATWEHQHASFRDRGRVSPLMIPKMLSNMAAGQVAIELGARGPNMTVNTACASGASAIAIAQDLLLSGAADVVVAGGVEAAITPLSVAGFDRMGALSRRNDETASRPFDADRDGFVMGEGAGMLVLERGGGAEARGVDALAEVAGTGSSADAHHQTAPPEDGGGAVLAMRRALDDAGMRPDEIDVVNAHGTSTPMNDPSESRAIRRVFGDAADDLAVTSTKGVTGHTLGAAGGVEAVLSVLTLRDGVIPPTANVQEIDDGIDLDIVHTGPRHREVHTVVSNSFGFGGQNAVLVLRAA